MSITTIKSTLARWFPRPYRALAALRARFITRRSRFSRMYHENAWNDSESRSGRGSRLDETRSLRAALPGLLVELRVRSMLDAPCGDLNWMSQVDLGGIEYIGADIVPELITDNRLRFASPTRGFRVLDLVASTLPRVDLVLCRDCLVHLSHAEISRVLRNIIASGARYLLTTTFIEVRTNEDIATGGWRRIDLRLPPFSWPEPRLLIAEGSSEQADKRLGLWDLDNLR